MRCAYVHMHPTSVDSSVSFLTFNHPVSLNTALDIFPVALISVSHTPTFDLELSISITIYYL